MALTLMDSPILMIGKQRIAKVNHRSIGKALSFNQCIVHLRSEMQKTVSIWTAKAKSYSASEMAIEILYLCNLLETLEFSQALETLVYEDNTACIKWVNHLLSGRTTSRLGYIGPTTGHYWHYIHYI